MQLKAYANCVRKHKRHTKYLGFLDIDEFIVPINHKTIPDYLHSLGRFSGVQMNWLVYGSGGAKKKNSLYVRNLIPPPSKKFLALLLLACLLHAPSRDRDGPKMASRWRCVGPALQTAQRPTRVRACKHVW